MEFLEGLGVGMMTSGALLLAYGLMIQLLKNPNYQLLAIGLIVLIATIIIIGIAICAYVLWKWEL